MLVSTHVTNLVSRPEARRWVITINNYHWQLEDEDIAKLTNCTYFISGEEVGENGTPHLQCYAEFSSPVRMTALRKVLGPGHFEVSRGTPKQASSYCKKEGDYEEWGELSEGQGARNDLKRLRESIKDGATDLDLIEDDLTLTCFAKYPRFVDRARIAYKIPEPEIFRDDIRVIFMVGKTGTGKSSYARELFPDAYWKDQSKWWHGYTGQKVVIWDEFFGGCCTPTEFNKVCDRYPHRVENKGGFVPLEAEIIIIISNWLPMDWWSDRTRISLPALYRRFSEICYCPELGIRETFLEWEPFWERVRINR